MMRRSMVRDTVALIAMLAQLVPVPCALAAAPAKAPRPPSAATKPTARPATPSLQRRALGLYTQARYDEAVTLLYGPIDRGELKGEALRDARILMARCYVKKGLPDRAKDLFAQVIADDPAFVLTATDADAEELAVFQSAKAPPLAAATPRVKLHEPNLGDTGRSGSWLSRHKLIAGVIAVGVGAGAAAVSGGGGGGKPPVIENPSIPSFPPPPSNARH